MLKLKWYDIIFSDLVNYLGASPQGFNTISMHTSGYKTYGNQTMLFERTTDGPAASFTRGTATV
ncbi:hypothetical protein [Maribacter sp. 2-571]|uniref:hypothetical protein n=1 Tax=Maribacter sp. 2-571 TaxID=3417569 RepID=UPI003D351002